MKKPILKCYALLHHIAKLKYPEFNHLEITTEEDDRKIRFKVMSLSDNPNSDKLIASHLSNYLADEDIPHIRYRERGIELNKQYGFTEIIALADQYSDGQIEQYY